MQICKLIYKMKQIRKRFNSTNVKRLAPWEEIIISFTNIIQFGSRKKPLKMARDFLSIKAMEKTIKVNIQYFDHIFYT